MRGISIAVYLKLGSEFPAAVSEAKQRQAVFGSSITVMRVAMVQ